MPPAFAAWQPRSGRSQSGTVNRTDTGQWSESRTFHVGSVSRYASTRRLLGLIQSRAGPPIRM